MVVTNGGEKMVRRTALMLLGLVLALGLGHATVFLTGVTGDCTLLKPGATKMYVLSIEESTSGTYMVTITTDGLYVYPKELTLNMEANKTYTKWVKVTAPYNVVDEYYTLQVSVFDSNANLVESREYCFHVYKGILETTAPDVVFGYKGTDVSDGKVKVALYVSNLGPSTVTAYLDSDYGLVAFSQNPVIVKGYRTVEVTAEMPVDEHLPEYVTFYAKIGDATKEVTVRMPVPESIQPDVTVTPPEKVIIDSPLTTTYVKVTNNSDAEFTVKIVGKSLPFGVGVYSDEVKVPPKETILVKTYFTANNVLKTGDFLSKICVEDEYGAELSCKYTVIEVLGTGESTASTEVEKNAIVATLTVKNGSKAYYGVKVEVVAPEGWNYETTPQVLDLDSYETEEVKVSFTPTENAKDGVAVIRLVAADGTVIAQKTVNLSTKALTGYATLGSGSSVIGLIIAAIIIALIVAAVVKKGKEAEAEIEEFEELTKKG